MTARSQVYQIQVAQQAQEEEKPDVILEQAKEAVEAFAQWQSLIPVNWPKLTVTNADELINLGVANLDALRRQWRYHERMTKSRTRRAQELIDVLDGKTEDDLVELAKQYQYPEFPTVGFLMDDPDYVPRPLDVASRHRVSGATTLNVCGWCQYIRSISKCHNGAAVGKCELTLPMYHYRYGRKSQELVPKLGFDTPCVLLHSGQRFLDECLAALKRNLTLLKKEAECLSQKINCLSWAMRVAEKKPCFVQWRPNTWFNDGDAAVCLVHDLNYVPACVCDRFAIGEITYVSPKQWSVSVSTVAQVHKGRGDNRGLNLSVYSPAIMLLWEYEYLRDHPDYFELWLQAIASEVSEAHIKTLRRAFEKELL